MQGSNDESCDSSHRSSGDHGMMFEMDADFKDDKRFDAEYRDEKKLRYVCVLGSSDAVVS